ncbi:hypothetical protein ACVW19_001972 [Streptomyces sp. TE5632]
MPKRRAPCTTSARSTANASGMPGPTGDDAGLAALGELTTAHLDQSGPALAGNRHDA